MSLILYKGSSSRLGLTNLAGIDNAAVTDATVTATIYDSANNEVAGQSWPLTLAHDADGNYYGTVDYGLTLVVGKKYYVEILAISGAIRKTWREDLIVEYAD